MLIVVIVALAMLALLNRWSAGSFLYPPAVFAGVWSLYLFLLGLCGKLFYPVGQDTLFFYFCGALAFSAGGLCCSLFSRPLPDKLTVLPSPLAPTGRKQLRRVLDGLLIFLLVALPYYWRYVSELAAQAGIPDLWVAIRTQLVEEGTEKANAFHLMDNLVVLSMIVALVMCYEGDGTRGRKVRTCVSASVAFLYTFTTATLGGITLALYLLALHWLKHGRITGRAFLSFLLGFAIIFSSVSILVRKGEARPEANFIENVPALVDGFLWYSVGGIVAFDRILQEPTRVPPTQSVLRPILLAANKLGANYRVPSLHPAFTPIGPGKEMNVYTIYFSYFQDFGIVGTSMAMFILGICVTAVYRSARRSNVSAMLLFSVLFAGLVLSSFAENLISALNFSAKLLVFTWALYGWARWRSSAHAPQTAGAC